MEFNEFKEIINPLDKLKNRPIPKKNTSTTIYLQPQNIDLNNTDDKKIVKAECKFIDKRNEIKINRQDILKNIQKGRTLQQNIYTKKIEPEIPQTINKITMKPSNKEIIESDDSDSLSNSSSDTESSDSEEEPPIETQPIKIVENQQLKGDDKTSNKPTSKKITRKRREKMDNIKEDAKVKDEEEKDKIKEEEDKDEVSLKDVILKREDGKNTEPFTPTDLIEGIPKREPINIKTSNYYLNNRKLFIEKLENLFDYYKKNTNFPESNNAEENELLLHQRIAREYLNVHTPYRGLLLYFGLGTGKSATAVAIAEGLKSNKQIFLMIPASLETNFINEIKKFGDPIYKKRQHWVFYSTNGQEQNINFISEMLSLPRSYIKKNKGAWFMDIREESNYDSLDTNKKNQIDDQLTEMIKSKYYQINYNANNLKQKIQDLSKNNTVNPFDNSVVIIDEAHKLISMIVNRINKMSNKKVQNQQSQAVTIKIYNYLMTASNCRVILLTGTPVVNYPNEIAVLFNMLRGSIKTWNIDINNDNKKITRDYLLDLFYKNNILTYDYINVSSGKIQITRNPFGFINQYSENTKKNGGKSGKSGKNVSRKSKRKINTTRKVMGGKGEFEKYQGVTYDDTGNITDSDFERNIISVLTKNNIQVYGSPVIELNKALPDNLDDFKEKFLNMSNVENPKFKDNQDLIFIKRILGLSYFYSVSNTDPNLPELIDADTDLFHIQYCPMSDYQFTVYSEYRKEEVKQQKNAMTNKMKRKEDDIYEVSSTYRVYSRASCNFAFPMPPGRPFPSKKGAKTSEGDEVDEDEVDGEIANATDLIAEGENIVVEESYKARIATALVYLKTNENRIFSAENTDGLQMYSPKFLRILQNIMDPDNIGLHLLYSQFRTLEGIGIFQNVLEQNGFVQFKLKRGQGNEWSIEPLSPGKQTYILYTGTEEPDEKELLRNIYNGDWENIPRNLKDELLKKASNNLYGEIIKVMMITSGAAEGINLRNTRFVHLMEPYWHMVRLQQVIGRARRFQSHLALPKKYQNVKVFLYLTSFSEDQIYKINNTVGEGELKATDISKREPFSLFTTDQTLFEMSEIKLKITNEILNAIKSSSLECKVNHKVGDSYTCYDFGNVSTNEFAFKPTIDEDILERGEDKKQGRVAIKLQVKGTDYYAYKDEKENPDITKYNIYSDTRLKNVEGTYDKLLKKVVLK
jgi:hypothetical protein